MKNIKRQGITSIDDTNKEEITYYIGSEKNIPITLLLMIASKQKNAIARYFNQITFTEQALKWQKEILKDNLSITNDFIDKFEGVTSKSIIQSIKSFTFKDLNPSFEELINTKYQPPYDDPLPLHIYAEQFAQLISMATPKYDSEREKTILTCPLGYINFWNREEFTNLEKHLYIAIEHVLDDVIRILKLRCIPFNEQDMTIPMSNYKEHKFIVKYGW